LAALLEFGWRLPDFPENWHGNMREPAKNFRDHMFNFMNVIHGQFDTMWAGDHFFPWAAELD
jgi:hypothetical protein